MNAHESIIALQPTALWKAFVDLNAIPRASKKEAAVSAFVANRGRQLGLETITDSLGNVLIRKPASLGYESHPTVVLQSHIDMVWQKNSDSNFDFETQGIQMLLDGDFVRADGTTLGADNGIGVATIFATLESKTMKHPPLECLFTIDEETGMTGAKELDSSWLKGKVLLNLDTEMDNELTIGCAGGADVTAKASYTPQPAPADSIALQIHVRGLTGGHSGMDIHLGRANANKLINRLLWQGHKKFGLSIIRIEGGGLRNAIPRESSATVLIPQTQSQAFHHWLETESQTVRAENSITDPQLQMTFHETQVDNARIMPRAAQQTLLSVISGTISGICRMSPSIAGLVQTSNNLARVVVGDGQITVMCLARSSVDSERVALTESLKSVLEQLAGSVEVGGEYPGWQPEPTSNIVKLMSELYQEMFGQPAHVAACHAGLECGIIGGKFPGMEMISFGPNIFGAHSPAECVQISSVQKFFSFYSKTLERL
jgi:dipeptidase D